MIIMGVDPGTTITGYGIVSCVNNTFSLVECGTIRTNFKEPMCYRLQAIYDDLMQIINRYNPDQYVVEEVFFSRNSKTALPVGQARGVALLAGANAGLKVFEYKPLQVKMAITGYGGADKKQVQYMVKTLLNLNFIPKPDDAADALALAICHAYHNGFNEKVFL
ncbi:crossover junction endodeoxyribonuclease RuvC [Peptococcaceae bacterium]|nr:crossover junction endodeoxyribonuclease RuvC [Peptococcaceae bacterium]